MNLTRKKIWNITLSSLVVLSPFLIACAALWLFYGGLHFSDLVVSNNDEAYHYCLVRSMIAHGKPLGYFGYNGTHATWGTFGPWSPLLELPYALFGLLFGYPIYAPFLANVSMMCLANLCFVLITKPKNGNLWYCLLINCTAFVAIMYTLSNMSDAFRIALTIVLAALLLRLLTRPCGKIYTYVLLPLVLIYAGLAFLPLALIAGLYLFAIFRHTKTSIFKKTIFICGGTLFFVLLCYILNSKVVSPYPYVLSDVLQGRYGNIFMSITYFLSLKWKDGCAIIKQMFSHPFNFWTINCWTYNLVLLYLLMRSIFLFKKKNFEFLMSCIGCTLLFLYEAGVFFLYAGELPYVSRYNIIMLLFCLFFVLPSRKPWLIFVVLCTGVLALFPSVWQIHYIMDFSNIQNHPDMYSIEDKRAVYEQYIHIVPENNRWDNTVFVLDTRCFAPLILPDSTGIQLYLRLNDRPDINLNSLQTKYMLIVKDHCDESLMGKALQQKNYSETYQDESYILMEKIP